MTNTPAARLTIKLEQISRRDGVVRAARVPGVAAAVFHKLLITADADDNGGSVVPVADRWLMFALSYT